MRAHAQRRRVTELADDDADRGAASIGQSAARVAGLDRRGEL
jgi:hypothetical protein